MAARVRTTSPGTRLQLGASVLSAARAIDTRLVRTRLGRFERVHRNYVNAQRKFESAESQFRAAQTQLVDCDAIQDEAVENLARALVGDGQPRGNPFEAFGAPAPGTLTRLPFAEAPQSVHQLVATVQRSKGASKGTIEAAEAADKAATVVEEAVATAAKLQDAVRHARRMRDALNQGWDSALGALRRGAQAAADEGAPDLYATLFPPMTRASTKTRTPEEQAPTATETPTATPSAA